MLDLFLQQVANGLVIGSTYAVVALGFALCFSVLRVVNFAHPDFFMLGMFTGLVAANAWPGGGLVAALLAGGVGAAAIGYLAERTVISPLRRRDMLSTLIATVGLSIILQNGMAIIVGSDPVPYPDLLPRRFYDLGPVFLTLRQVANLALCALLLVFVSVYVRFTKLGRATRAIAESPDIAAAFGVDVARVCQITIIVASGLAGLASVSVGTLYGSASAFVGVQYALKAFTCMLVAGTRHIEGVVAVAILLGVLEALVTGFVSASYRDVVAFCVLIGVLYVRPGGLFGSHVARS
jgi:branched-chain amino acid transport system permease protein